MQTDHLISIMTADLSKVDPAWLQRATVLTALVAFALCILLVLGTLGLRPDFSSAWMTTPVITKISFGGSLAAIGLVVFQKSLRPGLRPGHLAWLALVPIGLVSAWALLTLAQSPVEGWSALTFGRNWRTCLIAVPLFALVPCMLLQALARRGAPVDGRLTGASVGAASAGLAIVCYGLHCSDDTMPFLATWYSITAAAVTALSTIAIPRRLRW